MTSKERVAAAIDRKPVDKVPLGLYLIDHDTIEAVIGRPTFLRNRVAYQLGLWEGRRNEMAESMKQDLTDLFRKLDCVDLLTFKEAQMLPPRGYRCEDPPRKTAEGVYEDSRGNVWMLEPETNSVKQVKRAGPANGPPQFREEDFADRTPPAPSDESCFELLDHLIAEFGAERYIAGYTAGLTSLTLLGGMEQGMIRLALEPEVVKACNEQRVFRQNALDRYYIRHGIAGAFMEQDFGGTQGPLVSPEMFRELAHPYMKQRIRHVKEFVSQVSFHSCGSTLVLMDMFIDAGIDCYESIQTNAVGMSLPNLIEKFGDRLCIWGAVPLEILNQGTPDDARREVRRCMEEGRAAPGFILGPSHSIAFGTKYDNFMAMLDEFERLR